MIVGILRTIVTELWGLFVDDGSLALALIAWGTLAIWLLPLSGVARGGYAPILFLGCLSILLINVFVAARAKSR